MIETEVVRHASERLRAYRTDQSLRGLLAVYGSNASWDDPGRDERILADAYLAAQADTGGELNIEAIKAHSHEPSICGSCGSDSPPIHLCERCIRSALAPSAMQPTTLIADANTDEWEGSEGHPSEFGEDR